MCFFVLLSHPMGHWCIVPWSTIILQSTPKGYIQLEITTHTFISLNFQVKVHLHTTEHTWCSSSFFFYLLSTYVYESDVSRIRCVIVMKFSLLSYFIEMAYYYVYWDVFIDTRRWRSIFANSFSLMEEMAPFFFILSVDFKCWLRVKVRSITLQLLEINSIVKT